MDIFLILVGLLLMFVAFPVSIIATIVFAIKKKKLRTPAICIPLSLIVGFTILGIGCTISNETKVTDEAENVEIETDSKTVSGQVEDEENEIEKIEENEEKKEVTNEFTYRNMTVKYLKHEITVNDVGQTVLVVYYDFTNNRKENRNFDYSFSDKCFQNGIEVEHSYWHVNDESKNSGKEIKSDTTITVASSFVLGDSMDNVELEITPWISNRILFEKTLVLE